MDPEYKKAAHKLLTEIPDCKLAKLDGDEHRQTNRKMGVRGYPTIYLWKNFGKHRLTYNGKLFV